MKQTKITTSIVIVFIFITSCSYDSDESILRDEFKIPDSAELVSFNVTPKESGWFGREGLKIDAVFKFSKKDFEDCLASVKESNEWLPLPIPRDFLIHMFSVKSAKEYRTKYYKEKNEPIPEEGSVYNPTEEQLLQAGIKILPVTGPNGIFILKAAGTDIMHAPKRTITKLDKDLNDFMLAILDSDQKKLFIKVSTNY